MPYVRSFPIHCFRCSAFVSLNTADRDEARAQLEALGWMPEARKGGRLVGMCPACKPDPEKAARAIPSACGYMFPHEDTERVRVIVDDVMTMRWELRRWLCDSLRRAFCTRCGRDREECACAVRSG